MGDFLVTPQSACNRRGRSALGGRSSANQKGRRWKNTLNHPLHLEQLQQRVRPISCFCEFCGGGSAGSCLASFWVALPVLRFMPSAVENMNRRRKFLSSKNGSKHLLFPVVRPQVRRPRITCPRTKSSSPAPGSLARRY